MKSTDALPWSVRLSFAVARSAMSAVVPAARVSGFTIAGAACGVACNCSVIAGVGEGFGEFDGLALDDGDGDGVGVGDGVGEGDGDGDGDPNARVFGAGDGVAGGSFKWTMQL